MLTLYHTGGHSNLLSLTTSKQFRADNGEILFFIFLLLQMLMVIAVFFITDTKSDPGENNILGQREEEESELRL